MHSVCRTLCCRTFHSKAFRRKVGTLLLPAAMIAALTIASPLSAQPRSFRVERVAAEVDTSQGLTHLTEVGRHIAKIAGLVTPSVVHIESEHDAASGGTIEETGSGIILRSSKSRANFIVTNRHVIVGASKAKIDIHLADGRIIHPTSILDDSATDLAVLTVQETDIFPASWGDSDNLDIGHMVLAMGSPFGLSQSVTMGIVSAKGRRSLSLGGPREVINQDFLQTDAAINPGNSGGPLVDLQGRIIGINTAIASQGGGNEGIGFSIPINLVRYVVEELLEHGRVQRGYLGVKLDSNFNDEAAHQLSLDRLRGARVVHVYQDTPAGSAGLRIDDVVLNFDGIDIEDESHLIHRVSLTPVNKTVRVIVLRGGREMALQVTLSERVDSRTSPPEPTRGPASRILPNSLFHQRTGLTVHRMESGLAIQTGHVAGTQGVMVMSLPDGSESIDGLQLYDVIQEAARTPIVSTADFDQVLSQHDNQSPLLLKVRRVVDGKPVTRLVVWTGQSVAVP
ncbi:MAG: trypsin-like peptidase domain-containing protein [Planctomycetaceae bacterium]